LSTQIKGILPFYPFGDAKSQEVIPPFSWDFPQDMDDVTTLRPTYIYFSDKHR
jgi:hypothetical protein